MPNPMFNKINTMEAVIDEKGPMTIQGACLKTGFLLLLALVSALVTWNLVINGFTDKASMLAFGGIIVGFIAVICASFKKQFSYIIAPIYALAEGLSLGAISAVYNNYANGIVIQAVLATLITLFAMLFLYSSGLIKVTKTFLKVVYIATASIFVFYLITTLAYYFKITFLAPLVGAYDNVFVICAVIVVAAFNLIVDFYFIEQGANSFFPKYMEWYSALGLMVTIVWLYIEFLRLFSKRR